MILDVVGYWKKPAAPLEGAGQLVEDISEEARVELRY